MLITLLFEMIFILIEPLFFFVNLPPVPEEVTAALDLMFEYIIQGLDFIWLIFNRDLVIVSLPVILVIENAHNIWKVVRWILRKIPFVDIE